MAVSRLQISRILGLFSNAKARAPIHSGRKILSLEAASNYWQPTILHPRYTTGARHVVASGLKLHHLPIETAFKQLEESRQVTVHTDASARHGFGCVWGNKWARGSWGSKCLHRQNCMEYLETSAMVIAMEVWGFQWRGCQVTIHCDNHSVVKRFNGECKKKNTTIEQLFTRMTSQAKRHNIFLKVVLADTESDVHRGTDGLSKGSLDKFLKYIPDAETVACKIPGHLDLVGIAFVSQQCFIK